MRRRKRHLILDIIAYILVAAAGVAGLMVVGLVRSWDPGTVSNLGLVATGGVVLAMAFAFAGLVAGV